MTSDWGFVKKKLHQMRKLLNEIESKEPESLEELTKARVLVEQVSLLGDNASDLISYMIANKMIRDNWGRDRDVS